MLSLEISTRKYVGSAFTNAELFVLVWYPLRRWLHNNAFRWGRMIYLDQTVKTCSAQVCYC